MNGIVTEGDALIGCDGSRSAVRETVYGSAPASYSGQVAFPRAYSLRKRVRTSQCARCVHVYRAQSHISSLSAPQEYAHEYCCNLAAASMGTGRMGRSLQRLANCWNCTRNSLHPSVLEMIGAIQPETLFKWGLRDRDPLEQWTLGRVSTLGDAAHPTSPFLGQGAVMAIEDGMVLGRCFAKATSPEDALLRYERARKHRANTVQIHSRERANALQSSNPEDLAQDEAPTISAYSGTIQPPCQSEPAGLSEKYGWPQASANGVISRSSISVYDCFTERPNGSTRSTRKRTGPLLDELV